MTTEHLHHLHRILADYGIPKENLQIVDDVARAAVELGWESEGADDDPRRMAKVRHDVEPPIILMKMEMDPDAVVRVARTLPVLDRDSLFSGEHSEKWFLTHLLLHEIAHFKLRHYAENSLGEAGSNSEAELRFLREREADWWAVREMERYLENS